MMKRLKIAMMSMTHGHTRKYYDVLKNNPKLEWIAVSTANEEVRQVFLDKVDGIPCYDSDEAMLDAHPETEAVVLASENSEHLRQVKLCAARGIHILSMKIPTFDMDEYAEMERVCAEAGIVCQVELELHYNPVVMRMKELVASDAAGKAEAFNATNITLSPVWAFPWQGIPEKSYGKRIPIGAGTEKFRGGALCDHPHIFDLIREVTGSEFDTVFAKVAPNIRHDIEVEDMLSVVGKMKNGTVFSLDPSWSRTEHKLKVPGPGWEISPKRMEVNVVIHGSRGSMFVDCFGPNTYHNGSPDEDYVVQYTYFDEWVKLIDEFTANIENKKTPKINLVWHKNTIRVMNAVYESIASGKPVKL